jgi:hypothetical protein
VRAIALQLHALTGVLSAAYLLPSEQQQNLLRVCMAGPVAHAAEVPVRCCRRHVAGASASLG